jgi:hypothetical protein
MKRAAGRALLLASGGPLRPPLNCYEVSLPEHPARSYGSSARQSPKLLLGGGA